ncbi:MAG: (d)CMP kinase [Nitrospirae bacterium]|nr:(d)CMP kinase [Nitrospirota bacterium]
MKDVITIDGPSGAGKSTVSRLLAKRLGYNYLDTGALYRAVAWKIRKEGIDPADEKRLKEILTAIKINFNGDRITVNGQDVTTDIRSPEIGELSSKVSAIPAVRQMLFGLQREIGLKGRVVIEGRDIGTVIFPEAKNKFFLDASPEERGKRRYMELKKNGVEINLKDTIEDIKKRDYRDSTRQYSPLKKAEDAVYIDTSNLDIEGVIAKIMEALEKDP